MQCPTTWADDAFNIRLVEVPTENTVDVRVERSLDIGTLQAMQPIERMVNQRHTYLGAERMQLRKGRIEATTSDPELLLIVVTLAEESTV
jgi:hypothetical protein